MCFKILVPIADSKRWCYGRGTAVMTCSSDEPLLLEIDVLELERKQVISVE